MSHGYNVRGENSGWSGSVLKTHPNGRGSDDCAKVPKEMQ